MPTMDFAAAGLLDGLEGEERAARERLLQQLAEAGFTQAELQDAVAEERLALLPVDRALEGDHTANEIQERTGLPAETVLRIRRLLGLPEARPDDRVFRDEDIDAAKSGKLFLDAGLDEDAIAEVTRVLGEGMARLAATTAAAFVAAFLKPGDTEQDIAARFPELAENLSEALSPVLIAAYKAHLRESVRRGMIGRVEREQGSIGGAQEITICFADLVGFTRLGGETEATELGSVAGKLAELAAEVAERPVRLVKTIGDAAMFVSQEPGAMVAAALDLVDAIEEHGLPSVRAGIACGKALQRAGDFYGHPVNVASRVTGVARPASVLCTAEIREAAPEAFEWSDAGKHRLKGVEGSVPLYRARRLEPAETDGDRPSKRRKADRRRKRASS
jgi:adenylate cyclase